ncbi:hypothetical protein PR202_ga29662 [Eleusine coracana subsp. coracana]|uniref:WAT1-related protein n=1 Tax=Eleusine coracana subsp. coracana TaxID=191504 RepID=A0AAV5DM03_ELECO|nr:hypothetical protein PR202_ga29662 [Eleusine coracana subsp. coracana]
MDVETGVSVAEKGATANKAAPPAPDETAAGWKAPAAMVLVQLFNTGMVLLSKVAIGGGMFVFALLAYRRPLRRGHHTSLGAPPREGKVERDRLVCRWMDLAQCVHWGALATAGKYSLNSWAVAKKGPAYPPMFSPLSVVFTVVLGSIFIGDDITVGSLIGTGMVIAGLYVFLWAKTKELPKK